MRVDTFDYELPPERIAQFPVDPPDTSQLLVLARPTGTIQHRRFHDLPEQLAPGDCLVVNDTRVIPARLLGQRQKTGGRWEGLVLSFGPESWELMTQTRGRLLPGETITIDGATWTLELLEKTPTGTWRARPSSTDDPVALLNAAGHIPLPPYIRGGIDQPADRSRYQTIYADQPGAVAAPTAGLHFTDKLMRTLNERGITVERITLHVGAGTFKPVSVDDTQDHVMHSEWCRLTPATAERLNDTRRQGGRLIAVGTTVARTLESAHDGERIKPFEGATDIFIVPPYSFRAIDGLITNFHLPKSTLLMLVCAFAGIERTMTAYQTAIENDYRFYSYGDAMLLL